ncbi:MAG: protein kinase [Phycisphaerae bacterium]|nr:protein kinase [Phycisphaerae bacterium]
MADCPAEDTLRQYLDGGCSIETAAGLAAHIDDCPVCCDRIEKMLGPEVIEPPAQRRRISTLDAGAMAAAAPAAAPAPAGVATAPPQPEPRRIGGYEIVKRLSRGGQGVVYLARQPGTRREVALKVLPRSSDEQDGALARFRREAQAAARLNHPNIVTVYESGVAGGLNYIAMEYIEGQSLAQLLRHKTPLLEPQILEIARSVARALQHAHARGVLHRDVKPGNILVTRTGLVKLTDFGLAKYEGTQLSFQTTAGRVFGTPAFISPEQAAGAGVADHRSDIYSLGCVIHNMATGRQPFEGDNPFIIMDHHRRTNPPAITALNPQISDAMEALVIKAMAKVPAQRYQSVESMLADIELIRHALRAPDNARGGLAQIVAAMDQINVVARRIREAHAQVEGPSWRTRAVAAFLLRPMFWMLMFVLAALVLAAATFWLGLALSRGA